MRLSKWAEEGPANTSVVPLCDEGPPAARHHFVRLWGDPSIHNGTTDVFAGPSSRDLVDRQHLEQ
jgi:hypothetical protein